MNLFQFEIGNGGDDGVVCRIDEGDTHTLKKNKLKKKKKKNFAKNISKMKINKYYAITIKGGKKYLLNYFINSPTAL